MKRGLLVIAELIDPDLRITMEKNVKKKSEGLSWDRIAEDYIAAYNTVLGR
ncbi:hypothetical protein [Methanoculleus frigidifontis]|uniref:hypothetical protein n=1 Tax=Methanoculleus frigidifontis TaxID=2584085 RepID=UPI00265AA8BD|nr:hypothetical protein [Methanoculleus sp. FWC-SCC1]